MELLPSPSLDFNLNNGRSSPHLTTPSTPAAFASQFYFSAPTSPARTTTEFENFSILNAYHPYKSPGRALEINDFAFDIHKGSDGSSVPAEELFHDGKIKPQPLQHGDRFDDYPAVNSPLLSPVTTRSSQSDSKKRFWSAFLPKKRKETNTFTNIVNKTTRPESTRGRDRESNSSASSTGRRGSRSLSPVRVMKYDPWEEDQQQQQEAYKPRQPAVNSKPPLPNTTQSLSSSSSKGSSRRWRLRDFLLFRSASEGRTSAKDPFRKYAAAYRKQEDIKNTMDRSSLSTVPTSSRKRPPNSAHEIHYNLNRAVSEDLKKKTFLPYKQGILGRLAVNPTVHALANGFGSLTHN